MQELYNKFLVEFILAISEFINTSFEKTNDLEIDLEVIVVFHVIHLEKHYEST